eukprot:ANDGO_02320.mRNA.1 Putative ankyrin repeat protein PAE1861
MSKKKGATLEQSLFLSIVLDDIPSFESLMQQAQHKVDMVVESQREVVPSGMFNEALTVRGAYISEFKVNDSVSVFVADKKKEKLIKAAGVDVEKKYNIFTYALQKMSSQVVIEKLLALPHLDPNAIDEASGSSPFHTAISICATAEQDPIRASFLHSIAKRILEKCPSMELDFEDHHGDTPLRLCFFTLQRLLQDSPSQPERTSGSAELPDSVKALEDIARSLIERGLREPCMEDAWFSAAKNGDEAMLQMLVRIHPSIVGAQDATGRTAQFYLDGSPGTLQWIGDLPGASVSTVSFEGTTFVDEFYDKEGWSDRLERILSKALSTDEKKRSYSWNAQHRPGKRALLHDAVIREDVVGCQALIAKYGASVGVVDLLLRSPLHYAAVLPETPSSDGTPVRSTVLLKLLLENGASVRESDLQGNTPLHLAARYGRSGSFAHLLAADKDSAACSSKNWQGETALHCAAAAGHLEIVQMLLDGTNVDVDATTTGTQQTALDLAIEKGHVEVATALLTLTEKNLRSATATTVNLQECIRKSLCDLAVLVIKRWSATKSEYSQKLDQYEAQKKKQAEDEAAAEAEASKKGAKKGKDAPAPPAPLERPAMPPALSKLDINHKRPFGSTPGDQKVSEPGAVKTAAAENEFAADNSSDSTDMQPAPVVVVIGESLLVSALRFRQWDVAAALVESGATVDNLTIHIAAAVNAAPLLESVYSDSQIAKGLVPKLSCTICEEEQAYLNEALSTAEAKVPFSVDSREERVATQSAFSTSCVPEETAFHVAARCRSTDAAAVLLQVAERRPNLIDRPAEDESINIRLWLPTGLRDMHGNTVLHAACGVNHVSLLETLIVKAGETASAAGPIDLDVTNADGQTPLMVAAQANGTDCVQLLMQSGVDLAMTDVLGRSPFICGVHGGASESSKLIQRAMYDLQQQQQQQQHLEQRV